MCKVYLEFSFNPRANRTKTIHPNEAMFTAWDKTIEILSSFMLHVLQAK